jgi:CRP/FNR family transcriptional activator FtrB
LNRNDRLKLRRHPMFRTLGEHALDGLLDGAEMVVLGQNARVLTQGDKVGALFVVLEGAIELSIMRDGHEATMAIVRPVDFFVLASCLHDAPSPFTARTLAPARIVRVQAASVQALCEEDHGFALAVIDELAGCFHNLVQHATSLKLDTVRQRLAAYLLRLSQRGGQEAGFTLPAEKRVLASYLGMTPETLSRMLRSLRDAGVLVEGQNVRLTDPTALALAAGEAAATKAPVPAHPPQSAETSGASSRHAG